MVISEDRLLCMVGWPLRIIAPCGKVVIIEDRITCGEGEGQSSYKILSCGVIIELELTLPCVVDWSSLQRHFPA